MKRELDKMKQKPLKIVKQNHRKSLSVDFAERKEFLLNDLEYHSRFKA